MLYVMLYAFFSKNEFGLFSLGTKLKILQFMNK